MRHILNIFINVTVGDKALYRTIRYAIIFALMIGYVLISNVQIADHSNKLGTIISSAAGQDNDGISKENKTKGLTDTVNEIKETSDKLNIFMILMFLTITILLISEFLRARKGLGALNELVIFAQAIAEGDLTQKDIEITNHAKFQKIGNAINNIKGTLSDFVLSISRSIDHLSVSSDNLIASTEALSHDTKEQISNTYKIANTVEMMSVVVFDVTRNSSIAANSAQEAAELAKQGGDIVIGTINGMNKISDTVNASSHNIEVLGKHSEQIGAIIKVIDDIANQTNLLALNAAIEAARAGDQGRGFAVVADEVRKLAERTSSATNEISDTIKMIQQETKNAVQSMHSATKEVDTGVNLSKKADESLKQIVISVESVVGLVKEIAAAAEQQGSTGENVSTSLQEVANENNRTVEEVDKHLVATKELSVISQELRSMISHFRIQNDNSKNNVKFKGGIDAAIHWVSSQQ